MRGRQDFASAPHRGVHPLNDLSLLRLILEATVVVQLVMLLLLAASVYAWAVVFRKRAVLRRARDTLARFEREFWSGGDLGTLYRSIESRGDARGRTRRRPARGAGRCAAAPYAGCAGVRER